MMSASSSATTRPSLRSIPILVRYSAIKPMFLSLVRPDRISSPITKIPAVTISLMTSPRAPGPALFCRRNGQVLAAFSGKALPACSKCRPAHAYRAGPGLATHPFCHALCCGHGKQSGYMAVAFDEMNGPGGDLRPAYQELSRWLKATPADALE